MKYKVFIGIDVSKLTIDVHLHGIGASKTFSNEEKGFALFLSWVKKHSRQSEPPEMIICFEHTGMYSIKLATYLHRQAAIHFSNSSPDLLLLLLLPGNLSLQVQ